MNLVMVTIFSMVVLRGFHFKKRHICKTYDFSFIISKKHTLAIKILSFFFFFFFFFVQVTRNVRM